MALLKCAHRGLYCTLSLSNIKYQNIISDMPQYYYQFSREESAWCVHAGESNA